MVFSENRYPLFGSCSSQESPRTVTTQSSAGTGHAGAEVESRAAWLRLATALMLSTIGGVGMWSFPVALTSVQADFGVVRADASLPFTMAMVGFATGGMLMGWLLDRFGIVMPLVCGVVALAVGYLVSGVAPTLAWFAFGHGLIGVGSSAMLGPVMADISHWFTQRRGIAVAVASAGNYVAGTIWPPIVHHFIATDGWRTTHVVIGVFCAATMLPLAILGMRRSPPVHEVVQAGAVAAQAQGTLGLSSNAIMALLCIAGVACCVAMSMPQVH